MPTRKRTRSRKTTGTRAGEARRAGDRKLQAKQERQRELRKRELRKRKQPEKKPLQPRGRKYPLEIAPAYVFLAADSTASCITGEVLSSFGASPPTDMLLHPRGDAGVQHRPTIP